jgi:hypothetical protein
MQFRTWRGVFSGNLLVIGETVYKRRCTCGISKASSDVTLKIHSGHRLQAILLLDEFWGGAVLFEIESTDVNSRYPFPPTKVRDSLLGLCLQSLIFPKTHVGERSHSELIGFKYLTVLEYGFRQARSATRLSGVETPSCTAIRLGRSRKLSLYGIVRPADKYNVTRRTNIWKCKQGLSSYSGR